LLCHEPLLVVFNFFPGLALGKLAWFMALLDVLSPCDKAGRGLKAAGGPLE
jgi:hypothetical protein